MAAEADVAARNKEIIREAFEKWRNGSGGVLELLAPDARWTIAGRAPISRTYASRAEFLDAAAKPLAARFSTPIVPTVRGIYADGDMVVALWDGEATARDGKPYRNTYAWFMQMRDARIVNVVALLDTIELSEIWNRVKPE